MTKSVSLKQFVKVDQVMEDIEAFINCLGTPPLNSSKFVYVE